MKNSVLILAFLLAKVCFTQTLLQDLPKLTNSSISILQSSYDRAGLNHDIISLGHPNYYDSIPEGRVNNPSGITTGKTEYVICKIIGPAVLERFWTISLPLNLNVRYRFYFDGEATPRINKTLNEFFLTQNTPPFIKPLVQNLYESSGGFWSYIPMPVAKSLIVTVDSDGIFSQFGVRQLPRDSVVQSWALAQDDTYLKNEFNKTGNYPKDNSTQTTKDSLSINVPAHQSVQLISKTGLFSFEGIEMQVPGLNFSENALIKDKGNFHKGVSKFTLKINGNADTILLIKRSNKCYRLNFNFNSITENSLVFIDNNLAGNWENKNYRTYRYWENDTFRIPKNLYQGKTQITLQMLSLNAEPWCEYYYWISCNNTLTDSLDIATTASEIAHNYSVTNIQTLIPNELENRYNSSLATKRNNQQILDSLYIKIYFDDEITPSINAPIGLFFGTGVNDVTHMKALPCGLKGETYYNYFSMPFWKNARIELENKSNRSISNISFKLLSTVNSFDKKSTGHLKSFYNRATKTFTDNTDYLVANFEGNGKYIGTIIEANQNTDTILCWLEGNERLFIDDAKTPIWQGTGTEDYFNSTFYFYFDEYSLAQNGMTNSDEHYHKSMYRFHLTDPIYFNKNIAFKIQHGDYNNKLGNYQSLAFAYVQPSVFVLTDSLDVGNSISEIQHQYNATPQKINIAKTASFEGDKNNVFFAHDGYAIPDSIQFVATINPKNNGVYLLRIFDYSIKNQQAKVYVEDSLVGEWLNAGFNSYAQHREEYFAIPAKYTHQKSSIRLKIINQNPIRNWTEYYYKIYSIVDTATIISSIKHNFNSSIQIYPSLTANSINIDAKNEIYDQIIISDMQGKKAKIISKKSTEKLQTIDIASLANGIYFVSVFQQNKLLKTTKIVLVH